MKLFILYENEEWLAPLRQVLAREGLEYQAIFVNEGFIDIASLPEKGIYLNRLSASAFARNHPFSLTQGEQLICWLEASGRRVINGSRAIALEKSKLKQYLLLKHWKLNVPHSIFATGGIEALEQAVAAINFPLVYKYNCGGKGLGVQLIRNSTEWQSLLDQQTWTKSPDEVHILQAYIQSKEPFITRCEFIGGRFHYAIQADTSKGFELCPAEACEDDGSENRSRFQLRKDYDHPILRRLEAMLQAEKIDVAGIEFIEDQSGKLWTFDINCNTNYNTKIEKDPSVQPGLERLLEHLQAVMIEEEIQ